MKKLLLSMCALLLTLVLVSCQKDNIDENNNEGKTKENLEILINDWKEFATIESNYDFEAYNTPIGTEDTNSIDKTLFLYNAKDDKISCWGFEHWYVNYDNFIEYIKDYSENWYITNSSLYKTIHFYYDSRNVVSKDCKLNYKDYCNYLEVEIELWNSIIPNLINNATDIKFETFNEKQGYNEYKGSCKDAITDEVILFEKTSNEMCLYFSESSRNKNWIRIKKQKTFGEVNFEIYESKFTEYDSLENKIW